MGLEGWVRIRVGSQVEYLPVVLLLAARSGIAVTSISGSSIGIR